MRLYIIKKNYKLPIGSIYTLYIPYFCYNGYMENSDPILNRVRNALEEAYGERLARVVLFGSRARSEARPDSDYDVAVFLKSMSDRWQECDRLASISLDIVDSTGAVVNALPYLNASYQDRSPLMGAIRQEGVDV